MTLCRYNEGIFVEDELPVPPLDQLRRRRSAKWRTYSSPVIPMTVAEMDFQLAEPVRAVLQEAIIAGDTGYAMPVPDLGQALSAFAAARWDWTVDAGQVTAITDVGVGVVEVLRQVIRPGETVVFSPPVYPPFFDWVDETGARRAEVPLACTGGRWHLDHPALERAFASRPGAYILCNPHNPVGLVHTRDELSELMQLATRYGVTVISDEIHGALVLPGATFTPLLTIPAAAENAIAVLSASKAFNLAGLKCAAIVTASPRMAELVDQLPADARWRTGHLGVLASTAAYRDGGPWLDQLLITLDRRRAQLAHLIETKLPQVSWIPPQATYLAWLNCQALGAGDTAQQRFLNHAQVALEPGPRFGAPGDGYARLNFATHAELLDEAVERMASLP